MKSQLLFFNHFQLINRYLLKPQGKHLPRSIMRLIGRYYRVMMRFYSDIFDIYRHRYPISFPYLHKEFLDNMRAYAVILIKDILNREISKGETNEASFLALLQTMARLTDTKLCIDQHAHRPNHLTWTLTRDPYYCGEKIAAYAEGSFRRFDCPQHQQDQWDAAMAGIASSIIKGVYEKEIRLIKRDI